MDLSIHKSDRSKGIYWHKSPRGLDVTKAKRMASVDISKYEEINYITSEYTVLEYTRNLKDTDFIDPSNELFTLLGPFYYSRLLNGEICFDLEQPGVGTNNGSLLENIPSGDMHQVFPGITRRKRKSQKKIRVEILEKRAEAERKRLDEIGNQFLNEEAKREEAIVIEKYRLEYTIAGKYAQMYRGSVVIYNDLNYKPCYVTADCDIENQTVQIIFYFILSDIRNTDFIRSRLIAYADGRKNAMDGIDPQLWGYTMYRMTIDHALALKDLTKEFLVNPRRGRYIDNLIKEIYNKHNS